MVVYCLGSTESIKPGEIVHFLKILKSWPKDHEVISDLSQNFGQSKYDCHEMTTLLKFVTTLYQNTFNSI